jgi:ER membrane protein complex subunit 10
MMMLDKRRQCAWLMVAMTMLVLIADTSSAIGTKVIDVSARGEEGPRPKNMRQSRAGGKQVEEEKSFLAKYWMYLLIPVILMFVLGGSGGG